MQAQLEIAEMAVDGDWMTAGFGWQRYPELAAMNAASISEASDVLYPDARYLLRLSATSTPISPRDVQPAYLRQKVAEKPAKSGK